MTQYADDCDIAIIGGGILGTATAMALTKQQHGSLVILEAENALAAHQTGHNSGVIHSGLYYKPGSLKARLCVQGRDALYAFCKEHGIAHERCGKVVVATSEAELGALKTLEERGQANGLAGIERLDADRLREHEPHIAGIAGLLVPETGIADYTAVTAAYGQVVTDAGHTVRTGARVTAAVVADDHIELDTPRGTVRCKYLINCGGLQCDRVARMCGVDPQLRIVPFRGEYYELAPDRHDLIRNLVYPVPDPRFPFLGVHFTRMVHGGVEAGPNAVFAFKREGYTRWSFSLRDTWDSITYVGFRRLVRKHWRMGMGEFHRSLSKRAFVKALRKLMPDIRGEDLKRGGAGVRAQAVEPTGALVDDFRIIETDRMVHVLNAPSPAATAAISIGQSIADIARNRFHLT